MACKPLHRRMRVSFNNTILHPHFPTHRERQMDRTNLSFLRRCEVTPYSLVIDPISTRILDNQSQHSMLGRRSPSCIHINFLMALQRGSPSTLLVDLVSPLVLLIESFLGVLEVPLYSVLYLHRVPDLIIKHSPISG